jgi:hypothetical protein
MCYLAALSMKNKRTYTIFQLGSAVFMILALLWLTVSTPFVYASQQKQAQHDRSMNNGSPLTGNEEETSGCFGNSSEEKTPSSTSFSEEYLHDHHSSEHFFSIASRYHKCENADTYVAFHGDIHVPPPNVA